MDQFVTDLISRMCLALPVAILVAVRAGQMLHQMNKATSKKVRALYLASEPFSKCFGYFCFHTFRVRKEKPLVYWYEHARGQTWPQCTFFGDWWS